MLSSIRLFIFISGIFILLGLASFFNQKQQENTTTIGILQFASHPALDMATEHFKQTVTKNLGQKVCFVERNAQGSVAQAQLIAQQFHQNQSLHAILAVATPAAQACAFIEKERPIFITAVTDPVAAGLEKTNDNICGTADAIDPQKTVDLIKQLVPAAKTIGLLFNQSESNAIITSRQLTEQLEKNGFTVVQQAIIQESDLLLIAERLLNRTDVLLTPIDNTVATAITLLAQKAIALKKPVIVSDNMLVAKGALAAAGIEYSVAGKKAADLACDVLQGKNTPQALGFVQTPVEAFCINKNTAAQIGLTIPPALARVSRVINSSQESS
jgi:putative ABC transport system substrate-binding protein